MATTAQRKSTVKEISRRSGRRTFYDVLQISPQADEVVVQAAFRALARFYHPDLNADDDAAEQMRDLNKAYGVLSSARQRAVYDLSLSQECGAPPPTTDEHGKIKRRTACWRCHDPLEGAFGRYCGDCHWIVCEVCRGCGCDNPAIRHPETLPPARKLHSLFGWGVAGILALGWAIHIAVAAGLM